MDLDTMIARLEEMRGCFGGDCEVRLMTQPNWPFENTVRGIVSSEDLRDGEGDEGVDPEGTSEPVVVYVVEGSQASYGDKRAWDAC